MKNWTKKDLAILKREGFTKFKDGCFHGYIKKVGETDYMVYKQECTVYWAKYLRIISNPGTGYYDEDEIARLDDFLDEVKKDTELNKLIEVEKEPEHIDLSGKVIVIDGESYKLKKA